MILTVIVFPRDAEGLSKKAMPKNAARNRAATQAGNKQKQITPPTAFKSLDLRCCLLGVVHDLELLLTRSRRSSL